VIKRALESTPYILFQIQARRKCKNATTKERQNKKMNAVFVSAAEVI
jgi:hypothetical protein